MAASACVARLLGARARCWSWRMATQSTSPCGSTHPCTTGRRWSAWRASRSCGTVITHGPNNNFGVINSRNISPFGPDETVVSSAIGFTKTKAGSYTPIDEIEVDDNGDVEIEYGDTVTGKS